MDADLKVTIKQLTDGFLSLSEEYKCLAQQHFLLEVKLLETTADYEALRSSLPDHAVTVDSRVARLEEVLVHSGRNLDEWLQHMSTKGILQEQNSLLAIRDAEFACFKMQSRSNNSRMGQRKEGASPTIPRIEECPTTPATRSANCPMEQDMTVVGKPGQLGCPFASTRAAKPPDHSSVISQRYNLPTPRGSESLGTPVGRRSKRASFTDPIRPEVKPTFSPEASIDGSTGAACPIRFMDQHSPEDIAKYFEQHKHELPRSHEVCVKRFQANAASIKELDAKYGNLVTMIQGLGQKHQAMLPETPNPEEMAAAGDEQKSNRRVKKWATDVSEYRPGDRNVNNSSEPYPATSDYKAEAEIEDEERLPHFDRPLKEIRVGESPSRPWGVHIPSNYLEREDSSVASSSAVAAVAVAGPRPALTPRDLTTDKLPSARDDHVLAAIKANRQFNIPIVSINASEKPVSSPEAHGTAGEERAKCPFDHQALGSGKPNTPIGREALEPITANEVDRPHIPSSSAAKPESLFANSPEAERPDRRIVNYGLAIVAHADYLPRQAFENRGTLILGYQEASAKNIAAGLGQR